MLPMKRILTPLALGAFLCAQEPMEIVSTAQDRVDLGITIYHGGLAMIRDTRRVQLPEGRCRLAFADVAATIRPKSACMQFKGTAPAVLERNFEFDLISPDRLVDKSLGQVVGSRVKEGQIEWGEQISIPVRKPEWKILRIDKQGKPFPPKPNITEDPNILLRRAEGVEASSVEDLRFKVMPTGLRSDPSLIAELSIKAPSSVEIELTYLAERISWEASYIGTLAEDGKRADLEVFASVENMGDTPLPACRLQLLSGVVNTVMEEANRIDESELQPGSVVEVVGAPAAPVFKEESISENQLFTLDQRTELGPGQKKMIKMFALPNIKVGNLFVFTWAPDLGRRELPESRSQAIGNWIDPSDSSDEGEDTGSLSAHAPQQGTWQRPSVLLTLQNEATSNLGRHLPMGQVHWRVRTPSGVQIPLGESFMGSTPAGEEVVLTLSDHPNAAHVRARHRWRPVTWGKEHVSLDAETVVVNDRNAPVKSMVRVMLPSGSTISESSSPSSTLEPGAFDFHLTLPPHSTRTLRFTARIPKSGLPFSY